MINRCNFLNYVVLVGVGFVVLCINVDFFFSFVMVQMLKFIVFLLVENIIGNWDLIVYIMLLQMNIEGFVMGYFICVFMCFEKFDEIVYELVIEIIEFDVFCLQIKLCEGVIFYDGYFFIVVDVKVIFEYGVKLDCLKQVYFGFEIIFEVIIFDDFIVIVDMIKGGYGVSLFIFFVLYLLILLVKDVVVGLGGLLMQCLNGMGCFKFVEQCGNDIVMEVFFVYFKGVFMVLGVIFLFVGDVMMWMLLLMNGQVDVIEWLEFEQVEML